MPDAETTLKDYRCYLNNRLLVKAAGNIQIEIVNPTNRVVNYVGPARISQEIGLRGTEFARFATDLRCKKCTRFMARAIGSDGVCEIMCRHCKCATFFDLAKLQSTQFAQMHKAAQKQFKDNRDVPAPLDVAHNAVLNAATKHEEQIDISELSALIEPTDEELLASDPVEPGNV